MESATIRRAPPLPGLIQIGLIGLLVVLAAVAWALTSDQMSGMDAGPGTDPGTLGFFIGVWVVMMAAMMFPSIAPMVLMYVRIQEGRRERGQAAPVGATALFVAGYLVAWTAAGLLGYGIYQLGRAVTGDLFSWDNAGPYLAGGIILAAAVYQLTPLKDVCLRHCRSPFTFLMQHWRPGRLGALRMGVDPRRLVRRLLLGADGGAVRARGDEPRLDGVHRGADRDREAPAVEGGRQSRGRRAAARPRPGGRVHARRASPGSRCRGRRRR